MSRAGFSSSTTAICGIWLIGLGSCYRQLHVEGRALCVSRAFDGDTPAMQVDNTLDNRQPEAGRGFAGGRFGRKPLEPAEQSRNVLRGKSGALILDLDHDIPGLLCHHYVDASADGAIFDGVADQ